MIPAVRKESVQVSSPIVRDFLQAKDCVLAGIHFLFKLLEDDGKAIGGFEMLGFVTRKMRRPGEMRAENVV
jgi:hypothetical protein